MIVKYYNGLISITKLREMLKTTRDGTTAYHIVETLKELGFTANGIKLNKIQNTNVPFIANVIIENSYKHYIVVYEANQKYLKVADPASGIRKMTYEEFYRIWTGVNIIMHPKQIIAKEKTKSCTKFIIKLITPYKLEILKIGFLSLIITILSIIGSFFFQALIDNINHNLQNIILFFILILFTNIFLIYVRSRFLIKLTNKLDKYLTEDIFEKILKLPYRYYHNHTSGEVISRINDLNYLKNIISKIILTVFIDLPLTIFSGIVLAYLNIFLFLIVLIILTLYVLILFIYNKKINFQIDKVLKTKAGVNSFMVESISGFETVKGLSIENKMKEEFNYKYDHFIKSNKILNNLTNNQMFLKDFINLSGQASLIIFGVILIKSNSLTLSELITYNVLVSFFLNPIRNIIDLDFEIKEAINSLKRVLSLTEFKKEKTKSNLNGDIVFQNFSITLDDVSYILSNINLIIREKSKVLITGESGSGKSTLLKIIKGYYQKYEGKFQIDSKSIYDSSNIIYIAQKEILFTGTINYNLTLKGSNDLNSIIDICHVKEIINDNELGYNALLEEDGFNISGGQRQRIALARALHDFDILLIDEGLNGLDTNLERKILKKLFAKYKEKTVIIVSHRLDNLDLFNHFIKLDKGQITIDSSLPRKEEWCLNFG